MASIVSVTVKSASKPSALMPVVAITVTVTIAFPVLPLLNCAVLTDNAVITLLNDIVAINVLELDHVTALSVAVADLSLFAINKLDDFTHKNRKGIL